MVLLGDYVDRGPDSCQVLDMILELQRRCTVIALAGNHEQMLLQARTDFQMLNEWLMHGGCATMESYARRGLAKTLEGIPAEHWKLLSEQTLDFWETEETIFVHATIDPRLKMSEQPEYLLFWEPFSAPTVHRSGQRLVCGHRSQRSGLPCVFKHGVCIDTYAHGGGWLTCFDTLQNIFHQANEAGKHRTFDLGDLT